MSDGDRQLEAMTVMPFASAFATLDEHGARFGDLVVCIDTSLACGDDEVAAPEVPRFTRRTDAQTLLAAAERLCRG